MMESISGDEYELDDEQESPAHEEKIFVAVRLRPLNEKEIAKNDLSDWECINKTTIIYKSNQSDRPMYPNAFTFDRVYGFDSTTKQLYDDGVKAIALSVLNGINSSIFAYGQTSSGKTYTMSGITEFAIADIYDYINRHNDREFVLKFSAIEIYNECVKDLLSSDGTQLRLLDDPEKGTVVEKLTEANLRDCNHLKELIYVSEAERQIGETALNEMSSRSHQILRLTVESSALDYRGGDSGRTLSATVSFVDLAGSERASQTLAAGTRLKEGCHINRSLLTLGTVIRKLSKGGNGHVPYRNSKLTRILQNSLGGNARTAILCTVCPAHSHAEQSRNTLLFGSCAKDVNTNAQVNVVMSDKALVKQLQQELARLERELKMEEKMEELTEQRDLAETRLEHLMQVNGIDRNSLPWEEDKDTYEVVEPPRVGASLRIHGQESQRSPDENSPRIFLKEYSVPDPYHETDNMYQKIRINPEDIEKTSFTYDKIRINSEDDFNEDQHIDNTDYKFRIHPDRGFKEDQHFEKTPFIEDRDFEEISINDDDVTNEEKAKISTLHDDVTSDDDVINTQEKGMTNGFTRSKSCNEFASSAPPSDDEMVIESRKSNESEKDFSVIKQIIPKSKSEADVKTINLKEDTHNPLTIIDEKEIENSIKSSNEGDVSDHNSPTDKPIRKLEDVFNDEREAEVKGDESGEVNNEVMAITPYNDWSMVFEKQRGDIIKLWDECNTPLIHRTYFFLLFKGEQSDSVYMEVELRRLAFLKNTSSLATSERALSRERIMLSKKLLKKYSSTQRDLIFRKWGIPLDSKHRRVQLSRLLWSKTNDIDHIKESADMVAKLVGIVELNQTPKELFGLSFLPTPDHIKTSFWKASISFT
ncbi:unnamed protein product [Lactuca saligna]|uniref:Kinesin-like protein n=1 Tax=Lactuca saligna TaxID=75948 RepID=A0AA35YX24_LACSI|nr:unnamed protein product [Lactuca saligna]